MEDINTEEMKRHRSPSFNKQEVELLLDLVEKYRMYILNKAITSAACQAKESAWVKIARKFNSSGLGPTRSPDNLRVKWENLKRDARKVTKNIMEANKSDLDDINVRILELLTAMEHIGSIDAPQEMSEGEIDALENGSEDQKKDGDYLKFWNENMESDGGDEQNEKGGRNTRSQNFSPQECKLLLQCVKKEKKHVFCKELTGRAIEMKNHAWSRISDSYNKLSPQKRSSKMLRTKFMSMKKMAKKVGSKVSIKDLGKSEKQEKSFGDGYKNIKKEPLFEDRLDDDSDHCSNADEAGQAGVNGPDGGGHYIEIGGSNDPLTSVLNGDSGIGSSSSNMFWNWNQSDNKETVKLKLDLLKYQMETAKLERKRLEDAIKEEEQAKVTKETEQSLRLRAARLEATAAALRLPPNHPALHFPPEETRAHAYLTQTYHHT